MTDKIYVDTAFLDQMSQQLARLGQQENTLARSVSSLQIEVQKVAPRQVSLIEMVGRIQKKIEVNADHTEQLSRVVQNTSDIWTRVERKMAGQDFSNEEFVQLTDSTETGRSEREQQATWFKIGLTGLCIVGSVVAVIASGGAALPVIATGVVSGAVSAGAYNAADQYVEKGWEDIDWADAGKDAVIGGIVGGVTSGISIGGGAVANQATTAIAKGATTATGRLVAHTAGGAVSSVITGVTSRAGGEAISEYLKEGDVDWSKVRDRAFDVKSILTDTAIGSATGYVQGKNYNRQYDQVRKESYLQNNPYKKDYGSIDWEGQVGDGIDHSKPVDYNYEIPEGAYLRRTGPETGNYLRNLDDSFESASLPYKYNPSSEHCYRVAKPIPGNTRSTVRAGFDMPGGGTQYQTNLSISELIEGGYLVKIY